MRKVGIGIHSFSIIAIHIDAVRALNSPISNLQKRKIKYKKGEWQLSAVDSTGQLQTFTGA